MTNDQIEKFILAGHLDKNSVRLTFKTRSPIIGIFIKTSDYQELKSKNFWRIISGSNIDGWKKSHDTSLARIFNGAEITRLTLV